MLADLPWYDYDSEKKSDEPVKINSIEQEKAVFGKYSK
jgi:hypothetical protein